MRSRHLLTIADLGREGILEVLRLADNFAEVVERPLPKVPALRGRTVATAFFEPSTRTRLSFEVAAKGLSADTMTFNPGTSSLAKGESLRDTLETIDAMGVDALVIRHASAGVAQRATGWVDAVVINAGDGAHEHPTQALLDCFTIREAITRRDGEPPVDLSGLRILIVGDSAHSRVARSNIEAFCALGAAVTLVGPSTLLPPSLEHFPGVAVAHDLDEHLGEADVCYLLRLQHERMHDARLPSLREYATRYGIDADRAARLPEGALILHPGPINRGIELTAEVADTAASLITRQVRNGVVVRMAVLFALLGAPGALATLPDRIPAAVGHG